MSFFVRFVLLSGALLVPALSEDGHDSLVLLQKRAEKLVGAPAPNLEPDNGTQLQVEADPGVAESLMGSVQDDVANTFEAVAHSFTPHHGRYESRDANGNWWPVAITSKNTDGTYDAILDFDGTVWSHVLLGNIRRTSSYKTEVEASANAAASYAAEEASKPVLPEQTVFLLGLEGDNACPVGYRGIGDERSCKLARDALGLGHWGKKSSLYDHPGGCFRDPSGDVFLNNHTGRAADGHAPICEEEFDLGVDGKFEARDAEGKWWSVTVSEKDLDGTYTAILDDGTLWAGVVPYNMRKKVATKLFGVNMSVEEEVQADYAAGLNGTNSCPFGYKGIGDERTCHRATASLGMGKFGRKDSWGGQPAGCFLSGSTGEVNLNNHTGWGHKDSRPICEKEPELGLPGAFEARASDGTFRAVTVDAKDHDGSYVVSFEDGMQWSGVWQFNLRRSDPQSEEEVAAAAAAAAAEEPQTVYEAMDTNGNWWPCAVTGQAADGTFIVALAFDGTVWESVHPENMRATQVLPAAVDNNTSAVEDLMALNETTNSSETENVTEAQFAVGTSGSNACPAGYKGIGDDRTCKKAMNALRGGPWGDKTWSKTHPAGCYMAPSGDVHLNNHTGMAVEGHSPLCEKDFDVGVEGLFEARDQQGTYWPVTVADTDGNGTYTVLMEDGTRQPGVWEYNIRRKALANFVLSQSLNASCPVGYRHVDDERTCNQGMLYLGVGADYSAGVTKNPAGDVFCWWRTNATDSLSHKRLKSAICEKEFETGVKGKFEAEDVDGVWWAVDVASKDGEDYTVELADGTQLPGVFGYNIRRINTTVDVLTVLGANGTNECPSGYTSIVEESACKQAMVVLGLGPWGRKDRWLDHPGGCFRNPGGDVYFNIDNGSAREDRMPICGKADAVYTSNPVENITVEVTTPEPEVIELPGFVLGSADTNSCPVGYKGVGDERTCKKAMHSLGYGPYGRKASWGDFPRGCIKNSKGVVNMNNNTGSSKSSQSPICEKDFEVGVEGQFETLDTNGQWWPVSISDRYANGSYSVYLADGSNVSEIDPFNLRRRLTPETSTPAPVAAEPEEIRGNFQLGRDGSNACPLGYTPVLDEKLCQSAMKQLGLGPWGRADAWSDHPGGCFRNPEGDVYLNSEVGQGKDDRNPICVSTETLHPDDDESAAVSSEAENSTGIPAVTEDAFQESDVTESAEVVHESNVTESAEVIYESNVTESAEIIPESNVTVSAEAIPENNTEIPAVVD